MKLEWMGRNREFIRLLMKYINLFSHMNKEITSSWGISMNSQQWQVLECIIEYEDEHKNMVFMAKQLGLPKSTFSKYVKSLVDSGLVDRYQQSNNRKDIILKPSEEGRNFYQVRSRIICESAWEGPFASLEKLPDESLAIMVEFMSKMVADLDQDSNAVMEIFKLQ